MLKLNGGVYVAAAPSIWLPQRHRRRRQGRRAPEIFSPAFGNKTFKPARNNIKWSIENRFVGASVGGTAVKSNRRSNRVAQPEFQLSGRDFAFTPDGKMEGPQAAASSEIHSTISAAASFAATRPGPPRGPGERRYLARNPALLIPSALTSIAVGDAGPVFRTSPVEQWRVTRTQMRISGAATGPIEFGGKKSPAISPPPLASPSTAGAHSRTATASSSATASNPSVHRKTRSSPNGATFSRTRQPRQRILTSTDTLFPPGQLRQHRRRALHLRHGPRLHRTPRVDPRKPQAEPEPQHRFFARPHLAREQKDFCATWQNHLLANAATAEPPVDAPCNASTAGGA